MRPHMHERMNILHVAQPKSECNQRMSRRQRRIVIVHAPISSRSAIGRERNHDITETARTKMECPRPHVGVASGIAPGRIDAREECR